MADNPLCIRPLTEDDLEAVCSIEGLSFPTPWPVQSFISDLRRPALATYLVAEQDKKVIGYTGFWLIVDEAHITTLAVPCAPKLIFLISIAFLSRARHSLKKSPTLLSRAAASSHALNRPISKGLWGQVYTIDKPAASLTFCTFSCRALSSSKTFANRLLA
jgi:hypothetical protein